MQRIVVLVVVLMVVAATGVNAQTTTGRLVGAVVDEEGGALPGVTVTIASPALIGGARTVVTDDQGEFNFVGIAPGEYTVKAELTGWIPQERAKVKVSLGHAVSLTLAMPKGTFTGEIEVIDETPVIDPTQVNTGQVFDRSYMQNSAIGSVNRNYLTVVNQTAGVAGGGAWGGVPQPRVFGSTVGENAYFIDGVDTTDPTMATATVAMNFDAIGEIQFQTGGFEAEYGRATGGILNLVTRSGGNQFSGTLDARYRDASFQESGDHYDTSDLDTSFQQYSATLGGPILRDRMWFFAAYEWISDKFTPNGSPTTRDDTAQNYLAKITWQIDSGWRLTAKYSGAPSDTENCAASQWRAPEATAYNERRTTRFFPRTSVRCFRTLCCGTPPWVSIATTPQPIRSPAISRPSATTTTTPVCRPATTATSSTGAPTATTSPPTCRGSWTISPARTSSKAGSSTRASPYRMMGSATPGRRTVSAVPRDVPGLLLLRHRIRWHASSFHG